MRAFAFSSKCRLVSTARIRNGMRVRRRGVTMLETAIVAPLMLILLLGVMDLGIAVYANNTLAEAVRAGTRYAAVHGLKSPSPAGTGSNNANVEGIVRQYAPGCMSAQLVVQSVWPDGNNSPGSHVTVSATYDYNLGVTTLLGFRNLKFKSTSTMVIQH